MEYKHRLLFEGTIDGLENGYEYFKFISPSKRDTKLRAVMITSENTASFILSRKISGVSKNGNQWSKWQDMSKVWLSIKPSKTGKRSLNAYGFYRRSSPVKWSPFKNITAAPNAIKDMVGDAFVEELNKEAYRLASVYMPDEVLASPESFLSQDRPELNPHSYIHLLSYPMIRDKRNEMGDYNSFLIYGARAFTPMEYAVNLFGKRNYRKDLVKAVGEAEYVSNLIYARYFRNLVPIDWIVSFLRDTKSISTYEIYWKNVRKIFTAVNLSSRKRLLNDFVNFETSNRHNGFKRRNGYNSHIIADTLRMFEGVPAESVGGRKFRNWMELHDFLVLEYQRQRFGNHPIPETEMSKKITALPKIDDLDIIVPTETDELRKWGRDMNHCIGSHTEYAKNGKHVYIGILKSGVMIGNAQLDTKENKCIQILGKFNRSLEREDLDKIASHFTKNKIIEKSGFDHALGFNSQW